jgi:hypothetical protein
MSSPERFGACSRLSRRQMQPFLLSLAVLLAPAALVAGSRVVTNLNDSGAGTLRQAILDANSDACSSPCSITFSVNGTIVLTSGTLTISSNVDILGNGFTQTIINGNNAFRIFDVSVGATSLSNLLIVGGSSANGGGGIFVGASAGLTLSGVFLSGNSAPGNFGGAIYNTGTLAIPSGGFYMTGNSAELGGGLFNSTTGQVTLSSGGASQGNHATLQGGAIDNQGTLTINFPYQFNSGNSSDGDGGALYNEGSGTATLDGLVIDQNSSGSSSGNGGGIFNAGMLTLTRSTLSNNQTSAGSGGGLYNNGTGNASLTNVTVSNNFASTLAGGIFTSGTLTLTQVTVASNTGSGAQNGIARTAGAATATNSIVAYQTVNCSAGIRSGGNNISSDSSCAFSGGGDQNSTDPLLDPLAYYGGVDFPLTRRLKAASPAIDRISPPCLVPTDQRGVPRPQGKCDIGALEFTTALPTTFQFVLPATVSAGAPFDVTVKAINDIVAPVPSYLGTVLFGKSDSGSGPTTYTFTAADAGVHTFAGGFTFPTAGPQSIIAFDSSTLYLQAFVSFTVTSCPPITLSPATLPGGNRNVAYSQTITASGGTAPYTFAVTAGTLPTGLTLSSGGLLSGAPTATGSFTFTITATDANNCTGARSYTVVIGTCPTITVSPATLPGGAVGAPYSQTITASGGTPPRTFAVTSGSLPTGLTLSSGGVLSGTPTAAGSFTFTVTATDASECTGSQTYTVRICPAITLSPASLPGATVGTAYAQTITASGGVPPFALAVTSGSLPPGLTLSPSGALSGTPTTSGTFSFQVTATDANSCTGVASYTIAVSGCPLVTISPSSLPSAAANAFYSQTLTASAGTSPYVFAVISGTLPAGLSLSPSGVLSGTPASAGQAFFTVGVTDSQGCTGAIGYFFTMTCSAVSITPASLPAGQVGAAYAQTISGTGGKAPYRVSLASGTLPPGLMLSPAGLLSGTPTAVGSFTFSVSVLDANNCQAIGTYTVAITNAIPVIAALTPPAVIIGTGALTLTVDGSGFLSGASVFFNGSARSTTFVSATRLMAAITAADVAAAGSYPITVVDPGPTPSTPLAFTVCNLPGAPTGLLIANAANPAVGISGSDPLALSWHAPATGPVPLTYEFRINGDPYTRVNGTSVTVPARNSLDPITLFVRALSCVPGSPGPEASTPPNLYAPAPPGADFVPPASPQAGVAAVFTDTSSPQATSWLWIFDDGATSTLQSPSHAFTQPGTHKVALIASNGSGSTVKIQSVLVAPASGSVTPPGAAAIFDSADPERRRADGVRLSGAGKTWLTLSGDAEEETLVFLRLIDAAGVVRLERRLVIVAGEDSVNDIGAWGVTGVYAVELVSSRPYRARLEEAVIVREPVEPPKRPPLRVGGVR